MRRFEPILAVALVSLATGGLIGLLWMLGNRVGQASTLWLVVLAIPSNLVVALIHYYLLRGTVAMANSGLALLIALMIVNLFVTLAVAAWTAGMIGAGTAAKLGAHTFSWGLSYAYGQAIHDVWHGTWIHDD